MKYVFIFFVIFVLFYFTNSKCIETFSNFEEISACDKVPKDEDCKKYYRKSQQAYNDSNEPDYYGCIKGDHNKCVNDNTPPNKCINSDKCPSCGDLSKYNLYKGNFFGDRCTSNLDTCAKCLNSENNVSMRVVNASDPDYHIVDSYTKICPKSESDLTYTECDDNSTKCISDLNNILKDTMNSSGNCSIQSLYTKLKNASGELSFNCNGNIPISGQEEWLDEKLSTVGGGYCKPINASWTCNRDDIPSYCRNNECELSGDTDNKKCDCKSPNVLLQNNTCGKVTCKGLTHGLCPKDKICHGEIDPKGIKTYHCIRP